jgi:hypothetical protein
MRFEEDMVAYSLCEFGGGEEERRELQAYRETHFPALALRLRNTYVRHCWTACLLPRNGFDVALHCLN